MRDEHFQDALDLIPAHACVMELANPGGSYYQKEGTIHHTLVSRWESWDEYVEFIEKTPFCPSIQGNHYNAESHNHQTYIPGKKTEMWYGPEHATFDECMAICKSGWRNGAERIRKLMDPVIDKISGIIEREDFLFQTEGVDFDVAKVVTGEPEHWLQPYTVFVQGHGRRIYTLQVNASANCNISADQMMWRGMAVCALACSLEIAGFGVEIYSYDMTQRDSRAVIIETKVKGADEVMDLPKVAFALGHPGKFRRMYFKFVEIFASLRHHFWGYGSTMDLPLELRAKEGIYVSYSQEAMEAIDSEEDAMAFVLEQLRIQGVELTE